MNATGTKTVCGCGGLCDSGHPCPLPKTVTVEAPALAVGLARLDAELRGCEYRAGPQPWLRAETVEIDRECCAELACERCGHAGLLYRPYHRAAGRGAYRAFAVCPSCGDWSEF